MTITQERAGICSTAGAPGAAEQTRAGAFMLTLCRLAAPVSIRPPRAPHLKPFTFFMSRTRQVDGSERIHLHMGFFPTLAEAQKWTQVMRGAYPNAIAGLAPAALLRQGNPALPPTPAATAATRATPATASPSRAQTDDRTLSDTQVIKILETRCVEPGKQGSEKSGSEISFLRPEDTDTRRALKEAVVQGTPVSFAVQLLWSVQDIDLASVPSLSIFRAYTLYKTYGQRDGRSWYCLRLGFFRDAISAKQVAYYVRSSFASVAIVPVTELECTHASKNVIDASALSDEGYPRRGIDEELDYSRPSKSSSLAPAAAKRPAEAPLASPRASVPASASNLKSTGGAHRPAKSRDTLEQTLELLAASESWTDSDSLSETGVRHLKVDFRKLPASR